MDEDTEPSGPIIRYKDVFTVAPAGAARKAQGDKIILPQSALEELLSASALAHRQAADASLRSGGHSVFRPQHIFHGDTATNSAYRPDAELPQPLIFQLTNPANQKTVYAGIQEFSADDGQVVLSSYLSAALDVEDAKSDAQADGSLQLLVKLQQLPKGTYVHLRPLEAGYNPADWRPLLERQLRGSYTTLTKGAVFTVRGNAPGETFRFRIDGFKPEGDGICVVDTDLEVDIEALDEEQALETVRKIQEQNGANGATDGSNGTAFVLGAGSSSNGDTNANGNGNTSSAGGKIDIWKPVQGQVLPGDYVDYELPSWDKSRPLEIAVSGFDESADGNFNIAEQGFAVDLFASPRAPRQRARPRETEHVWANFALADADGAKKIVIQPTNIELEDAESMLISVHGWKQPGSSQPSPAAHRYTLRARIVLEEERSTAAASQPPDTPIHNSSDEEQCKNCLQWVPSRTMVLHENFCLRNNIVCPQCQHVFQKRSTEWQNHWHCQKEDEDHARQHFGSSAASQAKHDAVYHVAYTCPSDSCTAVDLPPFACGLPALAHHRTTTCPGKLILCQFCQLEVPQEGDPLDPTGAEAAETVLTGQTPHERADGARTTECYMCDAIVRMRDMRAHLQHHALDRQNRAEPGVCRDAFCGRTRYGVGPKGKVKYGGSDGAASGNSLGLCGACFAPLYVSTHDPDGKALRRRIERRYLAQLLTGCGKSWCVNPWCKTGRANTGAESLGAGAAKLLPLVKPLVADALETQKPVYFCVDEENQKRRKVAEMLEAQGGPRGYGLPWCVAACEAEGADANKAWEWLSAWAPQKE